MQKVDPYKTLTGALRALDNGGRFYNIFTSADDRVVSAAELKKVAGVYGDMQAAMLFLEIATAGLEPRERKRVIDALGPAAREAHGRYRVTRIAPADFVAKATTGKSYLVEGRAKKVDDLTRTGMILMPMVIGKVTTVMPVPTAEHFTVYEIDGDTGCLVLTPKQRVIYRGAYRFAGIGKLNEVSQGKGKPKRPCLEARYYTEL